MDKRNVLIVGGAGFIGSALCKKMVNDCNIVVCLDNLMRGSKNNIQSVIDMSNFIFIYGDANDGNLLDNVIKTYNINYIFHLAANSDIQSSANNPQIEFENTAKTTWSVLTSMKNTGVKNLFFASTSAVYGFPSEVPFAEESEKKPISYYGSAKLASEAFIHSFAYMNDFNVLIFRFPNVIGPNLTHGVFYDFIKKLKQNPSVLSVLGDGTQCKPYMHVNDLINGINYLFWENHGVNIYNIGVETTTTVKKIAEMIVSELKLTDCKIIYGVEPVGWKGDVPHFRYSLEKIHSKKWIASMTSDEASLITIKEAIKNYDNI